jgi:hypothetical protein
MRVRTISLTRFIITIVTVLLIGAYAIAALVASSRIKEIEWLAGLPAAEYEYDTNRPARYAGRLFGPEDRKTPLGQPAAAYWWSVSSRDADVGYDVKCRARVRSNLFLVTSTGRMPIVWTEANPDDVGIASDSQRGDYGLPFAIDVGNTPSMLYDKVPPNTCSFGERYLQTYLEQGINVEVVGCIRNEAIDRCDSLLGGVLSVPNIKSDMRHRLRSAMQVFWYPILLGLGLLIPSTLVIWKLSVKTTRPNLSGKDSRPC